CFILITDLLTFQMMPENGINTITGDLMCMKKFSSMWISLVKNSILDGNLAINGSPSLKCSCLEAYQCYDILHLVKWLVLGNKLFAWGPSLEKMENKYDFRLYMNNIYSRYQALLHIDISNIKNSDGKMRLVYREPLHLTLVLSPCVAHVY
ncbi:hypothetical protein ACJX0J_013660, partial [Zea mays]